jgi:hypothetical protein
MDATLLVKVKLTRSLFHKLTAIDIAGRRAGVDIGVGLAAETGSPHSASIAI